MTRILPAIFATILGLCLVAPDCLAEGAAADSTAPRTLDDYLRLARSANAGLQAANYRALGAKERVGIAGSLPDPRLQYSYYVSPEALKGRQQFTLEQEFPFFGKRGLRRDVSASDARIEVHAAHATALDVDLEVKSAFYQYVGLTETAHVLDSETDLLHRMREVAQVRYEAGTSEQQELLKIELSISRLADEATINSRDIASARALLNELIGRTASSPLTDPEWSMPDVSAIDALAMPDSARARRPEVAAAREQLLRAQTSQRLAKKEYIPDFMLGVDYEFGAGEDAWWKLMAGVNVPIWLGKRRAMVRDAEAMREGAEYEVQAATLRTDREVEDAAARARAARDRFDRFKTAIIPQAEAAFASSEAGYRTGRVGFLDYLDSERTLLETRRDYAMVMAELGMQMAALERAVGRRER